MTEIPRALVAPAAGCALVRRARAVPAPVLPVRMEKSIIRTRCGAQRARAYASATTSPWSLHGVEKIASRGEIVAKNRCHSYDESLITPIPDSTPTGVMMHPGRSSTATAELYRVDFDVVIMLGDLYYV